MTTENIKKSLIYYTANNWKKGFKRSELMECMQRHVACLFKDEEIDPESKFHHIGHIMCNCMMYFYHHINNSFLPEDE